jgi:23S rRNA (pseudouridine1915-N3)-methyltransferase
MKVALLWVGKTNFSFVEEGIRIYIDRIRKYLPFEIIEIKALRNSKSLNEAQVKKLEGNEILNKIQAGDYVILLDEKGKEFASVQFAQQFSAYQNQGIKRIVFVIGGAYGFSDEVYAISKEKISLSQMTFSHQIIRIIFLEQLYRSQTIIKGEPYHHE